jgi:RNA polymerase sigma-70 factor, ECF subfamily
MRILDQAQHDAFLRLFTVNEPSVRAFVRSLVPTSTDANDVLQEVAIELWRKFSQYDPAKDFRGWAFGIAKMKVLSWQRDRGRDRHIFDVEVTELLAKQVEQSQDCLESQREALRRCVQKLSNAQQQMLDAAYAPGSQIKDKAKTFGQSVGTFYKRLHRIRVQLVECTRRVLAEERSL